jgi:hypothetical protein
MAPQHNSSEQNCECQPTYAHKKGHQNHYHAHWAQEPVWGNKRQAHKIDDCFCCPQSQGQSSLSIWSPPTVGQLRHIGDICCPHRRALLEFSKSSKLGIGINTSTEAPGLCHIMVNLHSSNRHS